METIASQIEAVIGVWFKNGRTLYVKRSDRMENYPNVWSLLSIQFTPEELPDFTDLEEVQEVMDRMSKERLGEVPVRLIHYLKSARCSDNPMQVPVTLHLYQIELESEPELNPEYYVDCEWFTPEEYTKVSENATCGLCMRMWSDYCYQRGLSKTRFAPRVGQDDEQ
ncbi:MAG: hypothetical protein FVQ85_00090 [Planctomycetes bacterium]|nr:hypothetical protein [Planctomycetota bacterium]